MWDKINIWVKVNELGFQKGSNTKGWCWRQLMKTIEISHPGVKKINVQYSHSTSRGQSLVSTHLSGWAWRSCQNMSRASSGLPEFRNSLRIQTNWCNKGQESSINMNPDKRWNARSGTRFCSLSLPLTGLWDIPTLPAIGVGRSNCERCVTILISFYSGVCREYFKEGSGITRGRSCASKHKQSKPNQVISVNWIC